MGKKYLVHYYLGTIQTITFSSLDKAKEFMNNLDSKHQVKSYLYELVSD